MSTDDPHYFVRVVIQQACSIPCRTGWSAREAAHSGEWCTFQRCGCSRQPTQQAEAASISENGRPDGVFTSGFGSGINGRRTNERIFPLGKEPNKSKRSAAIPGMQPGPWLSGGSRAPGSAG